MQAEDGNTLTRELDMTRSRTTTTTSLSSSAAGQAGDNDAEKVRDSVDDCLEYTSNTVNDGHDTGTDRLKDGLDLLVHC